jgi:hypothetical protein
MKNLLKFFKAITITSVIYMTIVTVPALIGCLFTRSFSTYDSCMEAPDYMAGMSFVSLIGIIAFWLYDAESRNN